MTIFVTGGAGFIGANFILNWMSREPDPVVNFDKLTYAGNPHSLADVVNHERYRFVQGDIANGELVAQLLAQHQPSAIINFAAESHVDRSIHGPAEFIHTNVVGTFRLLEAVRAYWQGLAGEARARFRFLHISTDEVYGSLLPGDAAFSEATPYAPNSPYSATKAASDHLVRAYHHTYGLPVLTTNCSNNYGPYQFPEKLIPLVILNALAGKPLPIYGDGKNVRDWLYVGDHCTALRAVLQRGTPGATYNIGGKNEKTNLEVVHTVCALLDEIVPAKNAYASLISFVKDRPGHDYRYAIDPTCIERDIGWQPTETFESGIRKTVQWYLDSGEWVQGVTSGDYKNWMEKQYGSQQRG